MNLLINNKTRYAQRKILAAIVEHSENESFRRNLNAMVHGNYQAILQDFTEGEFRIHFHDEYSDPDHDPPEMVGALIYDNNTKKWSTHT